MKEEAIEFFNSLTKEERNDWHVLVQYEILKRRANNKNISLALLSMDDLEQLHQLFSLTD